MKPAWCSGKIRGWKVAQRWNPWYRIAALAQSQTWTSCWQCTRFLSVAQKDFLESLYFLYSQSLKSMRELSDCAHNFYIIAKRIWEVFTVRFVTSCLRAVDILFRSHPKIFTTLQKIKLDGKSQISRITLQILANQFCQNFCVDGGCLERSKKFVRNTMKLKYHARFQKTKTCKC